MSVKTQVLKENCHSLLHFHTLIYPASLHTAPDKLHCVILIGKYQQIKIKMTKFHQRMKVNGRSGGTKHKRHCQGGGVASHNLWAPPLPKHLDKAFFVKIFTPYDSQNVWGTQWNGKLRVHHWLHPSQQVYWPANSCPQSCNKTKSRVQYTPLNKFIDQHSCVFWKVNWC